MIFGRLALFGLICSLPALVLGTALGGCSGAFIGVVLSLGSVLLVALTSEYLIAKVYQARAEIPRGLSRSLELTLSNIPGKRKLPKLLIYSDPAPNILVIRSLGGSGSVLVSQGLIALLNEEELRAVFQFCLGRISTLGIVFQSVCSLLALWILTVSPHTWVNLVFVGRTLPSREEALLSPFSALSFFVLFPLAQFFLNLGRFPKRRKEISQPESTFSRAMQKISLSIHIWGAGKRYGTSSLHLLHPNVGEMLFPHF
jgi:heat shock protein HtpX